MKTETSQDIRKAIPMIMIVFVLSATMLGSFNIIAPQLTIDFGIDTSTASLLSMVGMLMLGVASVVYSTLSDYISIKKLILGGILLLNIGALLSLVASGKNYYLLLASVSVMIGGGTCGSGLFIITVTRYLPKKEHTKYFGFNSACVNTSYALGVLLGGILATYMGWKFLFVVPLISLLTLPTLMKNLPNEIINEKGKLDLIGLGLLTFFTLLLSIYFNVGKSMYLIGSMVILALFFIYIAKCKNAFINIKFFQNKNYIIAVLLVGCALGIQSAFSFLFPFMAQTIYQIPLSQVSYIILPSYIIAVLVGMNSGKIIDRMGNFRTLFVTITFLITTLLLCAFTLDMNIWMLGK